MRASFHPGKFFFHLIYFLLDQLFHLYMAHTSRGSIPKPFQAYRTAAICWVLFSLPLEENNLWFPVPSSSSHYKRRWVPDFHPLHFLRFHLLSILSHCYKQ